MLERQPRPAQGFIESALLHITRSANPAKRVRAWVGSGHSHRSHALPELLNSQCDVRCVMSDA
jgi:hypothetical protein